MQSVRACVQQDYIQYTMAIITYLLYHCFSCFTAIVMSECTPCGWRWRPTGEQSALHGNPAAGQVWRELLSAAQQGETHRHLTQCEGENTSTAAWLPPQGEVQTSATLSGQMCVSWTHFFMGPVVILFSTLFCTIMPIFWAPVEVRQLTL